MDVLDVLVEFGSTGRVGSLHLGAGLHELAAVYGMPWDIGRIDERHGWPCLYSYGDVEFVMCRCRIVASITVQTWRGTLELPGEGADTSAVTLPALVTYSQLSGLGRGSSCSPYPRAPAR
ncbi:hypothetical protein [Actinoallomurus rhizosphaericola]|uniref:hypothetical protein n=1 Tax=Actinoallomurus rhizosphaericola TaxID=2952536 RepID=UPI002092ADEF|nr:hypothetical protein [Actinoallomurus rhizosphaericola]MCO5994977.1 hypothetical protein [Actinoallomurus rhizosphaericola]